MRVCVRLIVYFKIKIIYIIHGPLMTYYLCNLIFTSEKIIFFYNRIVITIVSGKKHSFIIHIICNT